MSFDLKFDYSKALKRHNLEQSQVDDLRKSAQNFTIVPKSITNKRVIDPT